MAVPNTFATDTSPIPLSDLDANFSYYDAAYSITGTNITFSGTISTGNNLTFTGTANRIRGDFSNATVNSRTMFQTTTSNNVTAIGTIPNGTSTTSSFTAYNNSTPTNSQAIQVLTTSTETSLRSAAFGTGTSNYLPLTFYTSGAEKMRLDTNGNLIVGHTSQITGSGGITPRIEAVGTNGSTGTIAGYTFSATSSGPNLELGLSKNATIGVYTNPVVANDAVGSIRFSGSDGSSFNRLAQITAAADANASSGSTPGKLSFSTTPSGFTTPTERMSIDSVGDIDIGLSDLGSTTSTKKVTIASNGFAVLNLTGDYSNSAGEPGGAGIQFAVDGTGVDGIVSLVNAVGTRGDSSTAYTGTIANSLLVGTNGSFPVQFGTNGQVRATIDSTNGYLGLGITNPSVGFELNSDTVIGSSIATTCNDIDASAGPFFTLYRNSATPTGNDLMGQINFNGNNLVSSVITYSQIQSIIGSANTSAESGILSFRTYSAGTEAERMRINSSGNLQVTGAISSTSSILSSSATAGIGYATGAGGAITQGSGSGKATAVTLNKITGQITMNNAALAANTTVTFTLTNSAIAATDLLVLNHISGGTAGAYTLNAQPAAGSTSINVRNITAGSLSEAIVIGFAVIKGVIA